jgi:voltage-gated potassium channel
MPIGSQTRTLGSRLTLPIAVLLVTHVVGVIGYRFLWRDVGGTQESIDLLSGHCVLAGFGRVGREAAHELRQAGTPVVVIDPSIETAAAAAEAGFLVLTGDATDDALLHAAGVSRARGLIVTTDRDATNLYVILSARLLNSALFIVSRAVDEGSGPKLLRAGANRAVSPYAIGGRRLAHLIHSPRVVDFFETALQRGQDALRVADVELPPSVRGRTLHWLLASSGTSTTVLAVLRADRVLPSPSSDLLLMAQDHVLVLGTETQVNAIERTASSA